MNDLKSIVRLAEQLVQQKDELEEAEQRVKDLKKLYLAIEREDLPAAMMEAGLQELKLSDGSLIRIVEDLDTRLTAETKPHALQWLNENGFGGLIKTFVSVKFGRGDHDTAMAARDALAENYEEVELNEDVHHSTLKAFVKERMAAGDSVPMDLFNVYPYNKAIIKR